MGFPCDLVDKESACNAGDLGLIPGLGRSPGEGKGYPLQHSGLENSMDCIVHEVAKSWTWLSNFHFHFSFHSLCIWSFPGSSAGKQSACKAGDPGLIPGLGSSPGEGILQYSWAFLVAEMAMNLPAMWKTWVWSPGWEDSLEEGMATHSSILAWRILMDRGAWWATVHGVAKSWTRLNNWA